MCCPGGARFILLSGFLRQGKWSKPDGAHFPVGAKPTRKWMNLRAIFVVPVALYPWRLTDREMIFLCPCWYYAFPVGIATHMEILFSNSDTSIAWYGVIDDPNWFTTVTMQRLDYINKMVMNPLWILVAFKNQIHTNFFSATDIQIIFCWTWPD
jgi:hypothetical protein